MIQVVNEQQEKI